jgi:hypothetical protein
MLAKKFGEKLGKNKNRMAKIYVGVKFNAWNGKVIFEIILYINLIWIFATSKPYRI